MEDKINKAYDLGRNQSADTLRKFYDDWAHEGSYDEVLDSSGYLGPAEIRARLVKLLSHKEARILDVGSGTGLVGAELFRAGYTNVYAVDASHESLEVCRKGGYYKDFVQCLVGPQRLPYEDNYFDAAVSSGTFLPGHCDGTSLEEVLRLVKHGGHILIAMRKDFFGESSETYNLKQVADAKCAENVCSLIESNDIQNYCKSATGVALLYKKV